MVTHHLTSLTGIALLLAGALFLKPISGLADRKGGWRRLFVRWMPVLTLATCFALWVVFVAPENGVLPLPQRVTHRITPCRLGHWLQGQ